MKTYLDCIPCFFRQMIETLRICGVEDEGSVIVIIDVDNDAELCNRAITLIHDNDAYVKEDVLEVVP